MSKYSRIFVINPPNPPGYVSNKDSMGGFGQLFPTGAPLFPPLDLVYLGSYLVERGLPAEFLESLSMELSREDVIRRVADASRESGGSILTVIRTSAPTLDWDLEVCRDLKSKTGAEVLIYGPVISSVLHRVREELSIDYIVKGDPDDTVTELILSGAKQAPGLMFRNDFGWYETSDRPFIKDLDRLPFPKWELLPYRKFQMPKSSVHAHVPFLPMWSSRGCPIGCDYCPYPVGQGLPWRARSAANVVDEIARLVNDLGIHYIIFRDPMFSLNQRRVADICAGIRERGLKFEWRCETRVDYLNDETLDAMASAGCEGVNFGVESSDVAIQQGVGRRPIPREQFVRCIEKCRALGIKTFAFFIIGLPGDTVRTVLDTIKFAIDIRPDWVQFTAASPFIGTKLRAWAVSSGLVAESEYSYINSHEVWIGNGTLSKEQVKALYHFAKFFQVYLINRKGVLKKDGEGLYAAARSMADSASGLLAQTSFWLGSAWFRRASNEANG